MIQNLMIKFLTTFLMVLSLFSCKKENPANVKLPYDNYIIAGDSLKNEYMKLKYYLENISAGDSVPSSFLYNSGDFEDLPINIDNDNILDIRYGCSILYRNDYAISQSYFFENTYGNEKEIEFAVTDKKIINLNDSVYILHIYNELDSINANQLWVSNEKVEKYHISMLNTFQPYFSEDYRGSNLSININVKNKYIGIRRKTDQGYVYGWLRVSITNNERMTISGSAFSSF